MSLPSASAAQGDTPGSGPRHRAQPRPHGTRARYVHGPGPGSGPGCRCDDCTAANRAAASRRERQILYGRWQPFVDAEPVREHLRALSEAGIGWRRVAELTGVSSGTLSKLRYGGPGGQPPSRRVRPQTAAAILAITPSADVAAPGALVDGTATRRRLQALVTTGWSQARLAGQLGMTPANFSDMLCRGHVTAATKSAVRSLYDQLWNQPPPEVDHRSKIAASRARGYARRRGWAPPLAWDESEIDVPDGQPTMSWQRPEQSRHRSAELAEDAEWIIRHEGCTLAQAADRLGVSKDLLEHAVKRSREQQARHQAAGEAGRRESGQATEGRPGASISRLPGRRREEDQDGDHEPGLVLEAG